MTDSLHTVVAKAIREYDPYTAVFDFDSPHRDVPIGILRDKQADAALTAALSWLAAEAESKFPFRHCMAYDEASGVWMSPTDYLRSHIPPGQEVRDGDG